MKPVVATTHHRAVARAGLAQIAAGGNAVDAVVAAALAWPGSLASAGAFVAAGAGLGRVACRFEARVPGYGLSRPRRLRLLGGESAAGAVAASCAAQGLAAVLTRWGTVTIVEAARHARGVFPKSEPPPHDAALSLLHEEGVSSFAKGTFGSEAAKRWGPIEGGLLTRRDLIEARPALGEAWGPRNDLWSACPLTRGESPAAAEPPAVELEATTARTLSLVAIDRRGAVAALALDLGPQPLPTLKDVYGVPPNTLLAAVSSALAKKVGQEIPLQRAVIVGGEVEQVGAAGTVAEIATLLHGGTSALDAVENVVGGLLVVRRVAGGQLQLRGAGAAELP